MANTQMMCLADFEKYARVNLSKDALNFFAVGANDAVTLNDNIPAFKR